MTAQPDSRRPESVPEVGQDLREQDAPPDDPDALREEIDRTRDELEDTVDELAGRLASGARSAVVPVAIGVGVITAALVALAIWRRQRPQRRKRRR